MARKDISEFPPVDETNFTFTKKTLTFGSYIYQVSNITYVGVQEYRKRIKPPFFIFISSLVAGFFWFLYPNNIIRTLGFIMFFIGFIGLIQEDRIEKKYGLIFETNSGGIEIFVSKDKVFLENVVDIFYKIMDGKDETSAYYVNIEKAEIKPKTVNNLSLNNSSIGGNVTNAPVGGNVSSSVGNHVTSNFNI